jgi:flagellar assembly protein FliH
LNNTNKFLFDLNNFDAPDIIEEEIVEEEIEIAPPPPMFSEDDLEATKAVAHATGRNEGMQEERTKREQQIADALTQLVTNFSTLFAAETYREKQYEEESLKLSLEIIDRLAPSLQTRLGAEALKTALSSALKTQSEQAEIKIEVHPEMANDIDKLIEDIWPDKESAPRYKILADSTLDVGACALSWKDGGMVRTPDKTAEDIKTAIEGLLVEQVLSKESSPLTDSENNAINIEESSDSLDMPSKDDPTGENKDD